MASRGRRERLDRPPEDSPATITPRRGRSADVPSVAVHYFRSMSDDDGVEVAAQVRRVVADEIEAQVGVQRRPEDMAPLIADSLLDHFVIALRPAAGLPAVDWPAEDELRERLAVIEVAVERFPGSQSWEHLLRDLVTLLASKPLPRAVSVRILSDWITSDPWPYGAEETLEFILRQLQWPEMRAVLEHLGQTASLRVQQNARRVLEVYNPVWPTGEIDRTYRDE